MDENPGQRSPGDHLTSIHVANAIKNDRESVAWLVSRFTPLLMCQARQRISAPLRRFCDPDDAVADVWMTVLSTLPELEPSNGSLTRGLLRFASTVLSRRVRDLLEKHVINKPATMSIRDSDADIADRDRRGVITHVVAEERRGRVWESLTLLDETDREILVLHGIEGHANKLVAARLGLTPENVGVRYHRALKRLRGLIPSSVFEELEDS
jgi:RNA polymerase sigma-70 factor, ECF subfamily